MVDSNSSGRMDTSPPSDNIMISNMTWTELEERIGSSVVFLPVGSIEQHGPHLPLNVDVIIPTEIAKRVASVVGGIVAPPIQYGYKSQVSTGGGEEFTGTTSLDGSTLQHYVQDVIGSLVNQGAQFIVILNGHMENEFFNREAVDLHLEQYREGSFILANWWELVSSELNKEVYSDVPGGEPPYGGDHAAVKETSLMMYLRPDLVREDKIADDEAERKIPYTVKPAPADLVPSSGTLYKATYASEEKGQLIVEEVTEALGDAVTAEWDV